jgi:hypothetical protein
MKVVSNKVTIGLNGERYVKGTPFECDEETGRRLIAQGTVELVGVVIPAEVKKPVIEEIKPEKPSEPKAEKPTEEEFKKVGGIWRKK